MPLQSKPSGCVDLYTIGRIVDRIGQPIHRIQYVIRSRDIKPSARAGACRIFDEAAVRRIEEELKRMDGLDV